MCLRSGHLYSRKRERKPFVHPLFKRRALGWHDVKSLDRHLEQRMIIRDFDFCSSERAKRPRRWNTIGREPSTHSTQRKEKANFRLSVQMGRNVTSSIELSWQKLCLSPALLHLSSLHLSSLAANKRTCPSFWCNKKHCGQNAHYILVLCIYSTYRHVQ